jgi:hypothetical protein
MCDNVENLNLKTYDKNIFCVWLYCYDHVGQFWVCVQSLLNTGLGACYLSRNILLDLDSI